MKKKNTVNNTLKEMPYDALLATVDYSKKENQIGCGYCLKEKDCKIREPKINKAKQGCNEWEHWQDYNSC